VICKLDIERVHISLVNVGLNVQTFGPLIKAVKAYPLLVGSLNLSQNSYFKDPSLKLLLPVLPSLCNIQVLKYD
jgi:hypothetical protein